MKCIKPTERLEEAAKAEGITEPTNKVLRVSDERAAKAVATGAFQYCPKSEWKAAGRH